MKISFNWLKEHITFYNEKTAEEISNILTNIGIEVEKIHKKENIKGGLKGVIVGHILECEKHPNADKLKITKVDLGNGNITQIICGANNVANGQKVLVATEKTILYNIYGQELKIKKSKIRGEDSFGMICAEDELGIGYSHDGIFVLDENTKIGIPASEALNISTDYIFEISLTPNRADAMSHYGVARDLYAYFKHKGEKVELNNWKEDFNIFGKDKIHININKEFAPNYLGTIIRNVKIEESPRWLKEKLESIDIVPKNNIVDITNYILHDIGQPLHVFDWDCIEGQEINVRLANKGEKLLALDNKEYELSEEDLIIADKKNPLCFAGIIGGLKSAVTDNTKNIFLECAYFDPVIVRKTAKRHGFNTDASFRFERGVNINKTKQSVIKATKVIIDICKGETSSSILGEYRDDYPYFRINFNYERAKKIIGNDISIKDIEIIFLGLGIKIDKIVKDDLVLFVPPFRVDVQREEDLIEEILRIYGYDNIDPSENIKIPFIEETQADIIYKIRENISEHLVSLGFYEIMNNSLISERYNNFSKIINEKNIVKIKNPISKEFSVMRTSLLFGGLESISLNINHRNKDIKFFEFGKIYSVYGADFIEKNMLSIFISGNKNKENWKQKTQKTDFFYIKGIVKNLLNKFSINFDQKILEEIENSIFEEGINFYNKDKKLVDLGIVKKSILGLLDIKQDIFYAEFDMECIYNLLKNKKYSKIKEISKYPSVRRDLAILLDKTVKYEDIYKIAFEVEKKILKEVNIFDVYIGDNIEKNKKSYAISFTLQDDRKTLSEFEINNSMEGIQKALKEKLKVAIRDN